MDAIIKSFPKAPLSDHVRAAPEPAGPRPSRADAEAAVRTLIAYAGDDPDREGLIETPERVVGAYDELFGGYRQCPADVLDRTFSEIGTYDDLLPHAETVSIGGRATQVIGLDDLIRIKRHINRPKDRESLLQLEAIKRLREREGLR